MEKKNLLRRAEQPRHPDTRKSRRSEERSTERKRRDAKASGSCRCKSRPPLPCSAASSLPAKSLRIARPPCSIQLLRLFVGFLLLPSVSLRVSRRVSLRVGQIHRQGCCPGAAQWFPACSHFSSCHAPPPASQTSFLQPLRFSRGSASEWRIGQKQG